MAEMYEAQIYEAIKWHSCPFCHNVTPREYGWRSLGYRKTRRAIVNLVNRSLSTGYTFRILEKDAIKGWTESHMRGVKGYG